jgi:ATP-dependent DNA helicase RecQ
MPAELVASLRRHFGHPGFRAGQEEVVRTVLSGRDVLAVMPTGSGKSLGYQLPALLLPGLTLVVSPLIALMKDQVDELRRKGVAAGAIHSLQTPDETRQTLQAAREGALRLLYVSPERFGSRSFDESTAKLRVSLFAVDEAHCVSEWGHDFRPDYRRLADAARRCRRADGGEGRPAMAAFTATATPEVREDIVSLLGLVNPRVFVAGFDRPNIHLEVRRVSGDREKRDVLVDLVHGRRALVYCATRKNAERAASVLVGAGVGAAAYHAGLPEDERTRVQDGFASGALAVVCATNAFGMGIDRPDIDAVVHYELPGSLEAYYQEVGRAGRDGRVAKATLLWNYVDVRTREFLIDRDDDEDPRGRWGPADPAERERRRGLERRKLRRMIDWADATGCLRARLLRYFGEEDVAEPCGSCGGCARRAPLDAEGILFLRKVLSGVARGGERWGKRKIAAMLLGDLEGLPEPLARLTTTGLLAGQRKEKVEAFLDGAVGGGFLRATDDVYRILSLTPEGRTVMAGRVPDVVLPLPAPAAPKARAARKRRTSPARGRTGGDSPGAAAATLDAGLLEALKGWRREEASLRKVPAFVVFHDRTVETIAAERPSSLAALEGISGVGPAKLKAYGAAILAIISNR